jgi:Putative transposase
MQGTLRPCSTSTRPWSDGTTGIKLSPLEFLEKLAALVPLPRLHQVRYGGCLAPHSTLRTAIIPTPRQQGVEQPEGSTASPNWTWARLLKRVFAIDMERCPVCQQGTLRIIAAITEVRVIQKILRHVKLAADPPLIVSAQQAAFAWDFSSP